VTGAFAVNDAVEETGALFIRNVSGRVPFSRETILSAYAAGDGLYWVSHLISADEPAGGRFRSLLPIVYCVRSSRPAHPSLQIGMFQCRVTGVRTQAQM
jgi:hypothetical protein